MLQRSQRSQRQRLHDSQRWVVKIGSALLTDNGQGLDLAMLDALAAQICAIRNKGVDVVVVSSGAVAAGMEQLHWQDRPTALRDLQAAAAVGQARLIRAWEHVFQHFRVQTAQVLLTHADHSNRQRYLNARATLNALLEHGIVPVVNENDTVVTDEIRFGDNDTLGALVTNLIDADALILLTDQEGLFTADPRKVPDATLINEALAHDKALDAMAGEGSGQLGLGGMQTKLRAGRLAASSGAVTVIAHGKTPDVLSRLYLQKETGTLLLPDQEKITARKQWLQGHMRTSGVLVLDNGAIEVLINKGSSLLPVGVMSVEGDFQRGEMVTCRDTSGKEVARGMVNYSDADARKIIGKPSSAIYGCLGYKGEEELIHRDNMVLATHYPPESSA